MNILYISTLLAIFVLFMLIQKTEKKQNLIGWLAITTILILCYNVLVGVIITFLNIMCTLLNLSICNIIVVAALTGVLLKNKKLQKYEVKVLDIVFSLVFLILIGIIAYIQYGFPFNLKYKITDGSTHYYYAEQFCDTSTLLYKGENNEIFGLHESDFRLPGAYINEGILFKLFDGIILRVDLFILFDLFVLYLSGLLMFSLLKTRIIKGNKSLKTVAVILTILYVLGYQVNSMIYGFVYLSLALDIVIAFLLIMENYEKKQISRKIALPILSLLSFGIFFSYAYFIVIIYLAIIVKIVAKYIINEEKILTEENILTLIWTVINPLILGVTYFVILPSIKGIENEISTLSLEGVIYENAITNLIPFIPIFAVSIIYYIQDKRKNKNKPNEYSTLLFILSIIFVLILFTGNKLKLVSDYYCYKAYYIIWPLVILNSFKTICNIIEKEKKEFKIAAYAYIGIYVVAILGATIMLKDIKINNIFLHNAEIISTPNYLVKKGQFQLMDVVQNTLKEDETYMLASRYEGRMKWIAILCDRLYIYEDLIQGHEITIKKWLNEKEEKFYAAYYEDYKTMEQPNLNENSEDYKIIYQDEFGFILEKTK